MPRHLRDTRHPMGPPPSGDSPWYYLSPAPQSGFLRRIGHAVTHGLIHLGWWYGLAIPHSAAPEPVPEEGQS
ncbi:hypothetical protein EDD99_0561 [Streptomyces sp. 846.5]|nr:hypothetical protein EDD99_0561 [Streptomyces sp. 846.5]